MQRTVDVTKAFQQVLLAMKKKRAIMPKGYNWCPADEFDEFMHLAQERYLTHPPGASLFGKTVDSDVILKGSFYMFYLLALVVLRVGLASVD
jgi:hypothetical protein